MELVFFLCIHTPSAGDWGDGRIGFGLNAQEIHGTERYRSLT